MGKIRKKILMTSATVIAIIALCAAIFFGSFSLSAKGKKQTLRIDRDKTHQTFTYFGASSAWNCRLVGESASEQNKQTLTDMLYGNDGLKLSVFRYNLGGGSTEIESCRYDEARKTKSLFISENYVDNSSFANAANYDVSRDGDYIEMLTRALSTGNVKKLVVFCNSPHYLLTANKLTNGSEENQNNLPAENYGAFADYVLNASAALNDYLISKGFNDLEIYLSPVNEPQWGWGGEWCSQEGCHFDAEPLADFYQIFYDKLTAFNAANGTAFITDVFECGNYDLSWDDSYNRDYFTEFSKRAFFAELDEISVHSYVVNDDQKMKKKFAKYADGYQKQLIMSEYCVMEGGVDTRIDMGIKSAKVLLADLKALSAVEWDWWLSIAFGGYEDGLVYYDPDTGEISTTYRYYTFAQFMKYIGCGDVRIKADFFDPLNKNGLDAVAFKKQNGQIVVVIINENTTEKTLNLKGVNRSDIQMIRTADGVLLDEISISDGQTITLLPRSVTTLIIK